MKRFFAALKENTGGFRTKAIVVVGGLIGVVLLGKLLGPVTSEDEVCPEIDSIDEDEQEETPEE